MIMIITSIIVDHVEWMDGSAMMTRIAAGNQSVGGMGLGLWKMGVVWLYRDSDCTDDGDCCEDLFCLEGYCVWDL